MREKVDCIFLSTMSPLPPPLGRMPSSSRMCCWWLVLVLCLWSVRTQTDSPTVAPTTVGKVPAAPDSLLGMSVWNAVLLITCLSVVLFGVLMFLLNRMIRRCRRRRRKLSKTAESTGVLSQPANADEDDGNDIRITHLAVLSQPIDVPHSLLRDRDQQQRFPEIMNQPFFVPREEGAAGVEAPLLMAPRKLRPLGDEHASGVAAAYDDDEGGLDPEAAKRIALWLRRTAKSNPEEDPASSFCRTADSSGYVPTHTDPFSDVPQVADSASERSSPIPAPALVQPEKELTPERSRRWTVGSDAAVPPQRTLSGRIKRGQTLPTASKPFLQ